MEPGFLAAIWGFVLLASSVRVAGLMVIGLPNAARQSRAARPSTSSGRSAERPVHAQTDELKPAEFHWPENNDHV